MHKVFCFLLICAACLATTACEDNAPPAPVPQPTPGETRITGNEHIGWDMPAADLPELESFEYVIYVDETRTVLTDSSCAQTRGPAGFACTAPLPPISPGPHSLTLASLTRDGAGVESARSTPLRVFVGPAASAVAAPTWRADALIATADHVRLRVERVASGLQEPADLAFAPDGRLLVAEADGRVRVVSHDRLLLQPALVVEDVEPSRQARLLALAVDPRFASTGFVYLLYTATARRDAEMFHLARFRMVGDTLAQRAVLFDDIPVSSSQPRAALRFGPDGKLYAAFEDGGNQRAAGDLSSLSGKIVRLNPDGTTPKDQPAPPVYASQIHSPRGLDWQPDKGRMWVADSAAGGSDRLAMVIPAAGGRLPPNVVDVGYALPHEMGASSLAFYRGTLIPDFHGDLFVAAEDGRHILRLQFNQDASPRVVATERLLEDQVGRVRSVAVSPTGEVYFCTEDALGKLTPG